MTPPSSPSVFQSPGAFQSPCQNLSFDRISATLEQLGAPSKHVKDGAATPRPFHAGGSVIYKLKSSAEPTTEEFELQFARAEKKYLKLARSASQDLTAPDRQTFQAEGSALMNLDVELHFGGGVHSAGDQGRGSYVKVAGWFIDDDGVKQKLSERAGRFGAFADTLTYNHQPIDRVKVGQARALRDSAAARRLPAQTTSPARPQGPSTQLLAMVILDPEIVTQDLTTEYVSQRYLQKMAAAANGQGRAADAEFPAQFNGLMKALCALRPQPEEP